MRTKRLKRKKIHKIFAVMLTLAMTATTLGFDNIARAKELEEDFIKTTISYNKEKTQAKIKFNMDSVDKEKYDVISIISDKDKKTIYDKKALTQDKEQVIYEIKDNGSYGFTVKYKEKQKEEAEIIEESVKETEVKDEVKTDTEDAATSTQPEKVEKDKQDTLSDLTKEQEGQKVPESNIVKETKIIVEVSGIKETDTVDNSNVAKEKAEQAINNQENIYLNRAKDEESVDLVGSFNLRGNRKSGYGNLTSLNDSNIGMITDPIQQQKNYYVKYKSTRSGFRLGNEDDKDNPLQTVVLTSKYTVDYNRSFKITGYYLLPGNHNSMKYLPEGFAIAMHNEKNINSYTGLNGGGSLGIYAQYGDGSNGSYVQLKNAVVVEVDSYDNVNGDYGDKGGELNGGHVAINETDSASYIRKATSDYNNYVIGASAVYFGLEWDEKNNEVIFYTKPMNTSLGKDTKVVKRKITPELADNLKKTPGYISIAGGVANNLVTSRDDSPTIDIELYNFKYTDCDPRITTTITPKNSSQTHAIPDEVVTVRHEIWNNSVSGGTINDVLNLKDIKIDGKGNDLAISNIRVGTNKNNLTPVPSGTKFDYNTPLNVIYPANNGRYYVEYDVRIPNAENYGELSKLNSTVLLGSKGMSQLKSSGSIDVRNKPAVYTKKGENIKSQSDVVKVSGVSDVTRALFWKDLFAKVAGSEEKLLQEGNSYSDKNVTWEYSVNGIKSERFPDNIREGDLCSMKVTVTDKLDSRLSNEFTRFVVVGANPGQDGYYVNAEDLKPISETKLATMTTDEFKEYVKRESKAKAFKINLNTGTVEDKDVEVDTTGWLNSGGTHAYKLPGNSTIQIHVTEKPDVVININQEVTDNTWSYDTADRTEANGASGYIVIPKYVNMESGSGTDKGKLVAESEIFFANYPSATNVSYGVSVEKQFDLIKTDDPSSKVPVTSSANNGQDIGNNKLYIGKIDNQNKKGKGLNVKFTGPRAEVDKSKGRWSGKVTFYFERKS
ncbi:hypothetical protein QJR26_18140 (plasmid) [Clostridium baratii]